MSSGYSVEYYLSSSGENPVVIFLDSLSHREQAKVLRIFQHLEAYGLQSILPHVKKLTGTPFWEIRILGKDSIRILYLIPKKETVLVLHGFIKKTQKTSPAEFKIALKRYEDWLIRSKSTLDK